MNRKFLTALALFLGVSIATAILFQIVCGAFIIFGTVVIVIELKGCHKIPASSQPVYTNAPAPPTVPTNSTSSGTNNFSAAPRTLTISVGDDDQIAFNIAGQFPTNLDHQGREYHTMVECVPFKNGSNSEFLTNCLIRTYWSGTNDNGETLAVVFDQGVQIFAGYVDRALSVNPFYLPAPDAPKQFYRPLTNYTVSYPTNESGGEMRSMSTITISPEMLKASAAQQKASEDEMVKMLEEAQAEAAAQRATRKSLVK